MSKTKYTYVFDKKGAIVPEDILPEEIWIDIGNSDRPQVFDHHQMHGCKSSFECMLTRWDSQMGARMHEWKTSDQFPGEVTIHVHEHPDIDCIASTFLIQEVINQRVEKPEEVFSASVLDALCVYVNDIDRGKNKILSGPTLYAYLNHIGDVNGDVTEESRAALTEGISVMQRVADALVERQGKLDLFTTPLKEYMDIRKLPYYKKVEAELESSRNGYLKEKKENLVELKAVNLWNRVEKCMKPVKAAIWKCMPDGGNEYIWAREEDHCLLTVYPYSIRSENDMETLTQVIIALNPGMEEAKEYTLRPIVEILEQYEQLEENGMFFRTGHYRRDHSCARESVGRFAEVPFSETSDPWFFSEAEDIIDAPKAKSLLPYQTILTLIEHASAVSVAKKAEFLVLQELEQGICVKPVKQYETLENISFGDLYQTSEKCLAQMFQKDTAGYLCVLVEVDAAVLSYGNVWLQNCCLNLVGKQESEMNRDNILFPDYRTCIYVDRTMTVIVYAKSKNSVIGHLVNGSLENSAICGDLNRILEQQRELRAIGEGVARSTENMQADSSMIEQFNTRLICLSAKMQRDDLIADPIEQEVYSFMKKNIGIDELKKSVLTSADLLIQNAQQKRDREEKEERLRQEKREKQAEDAERRRDNQIQAIMGIFALLGVFSALVDSFDFVSRFFPEENFRDFSVGEKCIEFIVIAVIGVVGVVAVYYAVKALICARNDNKKNKSKDEKQEDC